MQKSLFVIGLACLCGLPAPVFAFTCTNDGTAAAMAPSDNGNATSTACGDTADATGADSTALGGNATSVGGSSVAVGKSASSSGLSSIAVGQASQATGNYGVAMGWAAKANAEAVVAIGQGAAAYDANGIAIGELSTSGPSGIGIGESTFATDQGIAIGYDAANGNGRAIAIGWLSIASNINSIAMGSAAQANGANSVAIGEWAQADSDNSVVLGSSAGVNNATVFSNVGIGTPAPSAPLHIFRDDATQSFMFLESDELGGPQDRAMMQLTNNGGIRFQFDNLELGTAWRFQAATGNDNNFEITAVGTGEIEFRLDDEGSLDLTGNLSANNVFLDGIVYENSDRNVKTDIIEVNADHVLERLVALPIAHWSYIESAGTRHIGPMAQDFYAAFGTGETDTKLAALDLGGVALASIQALEKRNRVLVQELTELKAEMAALRALVTGTQ